MNKNNINYLKTAGAIASLMLALPAFGQTVSGDINASSNVNVPPPNLGQNIKTIRENFRHTATSTRQETQNQIKTNREQFRINTKNLRGTASGTAEIKAEFDAMKAKNQGLRASTTAEIKARFDAMRTDIKNQILQFKQGKKVKLDQLKKDLIKKHIDQAFERLNAALSRLQELDQKIQTKIAERKSQGVDVSAAVTAEATASASLKDAIVAVLAINSGINDAIASTTALSAESLTTNVKAAETAIKTAREKYAAVLEALGISTEARENVNVTASTTNASASTSGEIDAGSHE